jgi:hypothetical protein
MKKHKHHVVPRHKGGEDSADNLILLDPVAHAELHALRFLEGEDEWFCAMQEGWALLDPELQEEVRQKMSSHNLMRDPKKVAKMVQTQRELGTYDRQSQRMRDNNPMKNPEVVAKVSEKKRGQPSSRLGATLSEETKEKLRQANLGKTHSDESRAKMSESRAGKKRGPYKKWSEEDKKAHSQRMKEMWEKRKNG